MNREQAPNLRKVAANGRSSEVARCRGDRINGSRSASAQALAFFSACLLLKWFREQNSCSDSGGQPLSIPVI
jgi:hypothetical protein